MAIKKKKKTELLSLEGHALLFSKTLYTNTYIYMSDIEIQTLLSFNDKNIGTYPKMQQSYPTTFL